MFACDTNNKQIDILALTETWLTDQDHDSVLNLPSEYIIHRKDRPAPGGGGVLLAINNDLHPVRHPFIHS